MGKYWKKLTAIAVAAVMLFQAAPGVPSLVTTAEGAENSTIKLTYDPSYTDNSNLTTAEVVVGGNVKVNEEYDYGTIFQNDPALVLSAQNKEQINHLEFKNNQREYVQVSSESPKTVTILPHFKNLYLPNNQGLATLAVEGSYYANLTKGFAVINNTTSATATTNLVMPIMEKSDIVFVYHGNEADGVPTIGISSKSGFFDTVEAAFWGPATEGQTTAAAPTSIPQRNLVIEFDRDGKRYQMTIPSLFSKKENDGQYSNKIYEGFTISVSYSPPSSEPLMLTVYTPKYAVERVGESISRNISQFFKFVEGDNKDHIKNPFEMLTSVKRFNETFEIQWYWKPDNASGNSAIQIPLYVNKDDSGKGFGNGSGFMEAAVTQSYDDVSGRLVARVIYPGRPAQFNQEEMKEYYDDFEIKVIVEGTGTPPHVEQYGNKVTVGSSGNLDTIFSNTQMPSNVRMDLYDGRYDDFPKDPTKDLPYLYTLQLRMGKDNGAALYAKIELESGNENVTSITADRTDSVNGKIVNLGDEIKNPSGDVTNEGTMYVHFLASAVGSATYKITYYVKDNQGNPTPTVRGQTKFSITVEDSSPEDDAALSNLILRDDSRSQIAFGFSPETLEYDIDIPYAAEGVTIAPTVRGKKADRKVRLEVYNMRGQLEDTYSQDVVSGFESKKILLPENETWDVKVIVTAQNKTYWTYKLSLRHLPPSDDATLSKLSILDTSGTELLTDFDPETPDYKLTVPFKTSEVQVLISPNHYGASFTTDPPLEKRGPFGKAEWLTLNEPNDETPPTTLKVTVVPEDESVDHYRYYTVEITREPPSSVSTLDSLTVQDKDDQTLNYKPAFHKDMSTGDAYVVDTIPYTMDKVKLGAKPTEPNAKMEAVYTVNGKIVRQVFTAETTTKAISIPFIENEGDYFEITIEVTAENGVSKTSYPVHIVRNPPSEDSTLGSLKITDQDGADVAYDPVFATDTTSYTASVPYETEKVAVTLTPSYEGAKVKVNGRNVTAGEPSSLIKLPENKTTTITVQVIAENGKATQKYTIKIKRGKPSNDARLKSLTTTGTENWQPLFIPDVLDYTAEVTVGEKGVTITAIPNHAYATVKIDGKRVENGAASELIELMKVKQKIEIEVTAQDGKTKRVYTITFTDRNKIELTDNANLSSLKVIPGEMTPKFQPSVTYYDVAVKEDVSSVQIVPKAEDEYATVKVMAGSKEIGDWDNNYAQQIVDGENEFTITVTSASGKVTKEYQVLVHRNDNANMGTLTPLSPDDINFELTGDVIQVDITKYPRIEADVFNTIKEEYPEKTIVFQGNDYSLEFRGEDLDTIVPQTEIFDFSLSFTSPQKNDILDVLDQYPGNDEARIVYVYFDHHGALPGPATFTISLGTKYESDTMFWHYYNPERNRIDYYGSVKTNSKGTFAVRIDHMSTYLVADQRLVGSENKTAAVLDSSANVAATAGENLSASTSATKPNPGTGVGKEQE